MGSAVDRRARPSGWGCAARRRVASRRASTPRSPRGPPTGSPAGRRGRAPRVHPGEIVVDGNLPDRSPILVRTGTRQRICSARSLDRRPDPRATSTRSGSPPRSTEDDELMVAPAQRGGPTRPAEIDVVEEVARHHGYDRLGRTVPVSPDPGAAHRRTSRRCARCGDVLVDNGVPRGHAQAVPRARRARPLRRAHRRRHGGQPAGRRGVGAAHVAAARGSGHAAGTTPPTANSACRLFEIGHCYAMAAPGEATTPTEWAELGVASEAPSPRRGRAGHGSWSSAWGCRSRRSPRPRCAGLHPTRGGRR